MKKSSKKSIVIIAVIAACAVVGSLFGVKAYQAKQKAEAEKAAIEKEYAGYEKSYKSAEFQIENSIYENDTNAGDTNAQEKLRSDAKTTLTKYQSKIKSKKLTAKEKKSFEKLIKDTKKQYDLSASIVSENSNTILSLDTASLGEYYTDDLKSSDESLKKQYETDAKAGKYQSAYNALNQMNANYTAAANNKTAAEQKAAEEAAAAEAAKKEAEQKQAAATNTKNGSKNGGRNGSKSTVNNGSGNASAGTNNGGSTNGSASASNGSSTSASTNGGGKDWKNSPIDYNHYYKPEEVPDGYKIAPSFYGVPVKGASDSIYISEAEAQAMIAHHPSYKIVELNGHRVLADDGDAYRNGCFFIQ